MASVRTIHSFFIQGKFGKFDGFRLSDFLQLEPRNIFDWDKTGFPLCE
jgi:hypothetical protein